MKIFKTIFSLLLLSTPLCSNLQNYFKEIENKGDSHNMRNIDFIYMINLDERPEKFNKSVKQLAPYGINPYRFSAVNGWKLSNETLNDVGVKFDSSMTRGIMGTCYLMDGEKEYISHERIEQEGKNYFSHCMARGAVGIVLSQLSILQDAYDSGYETIWVMEDDIEVHSDPRQISDLIDVLDSKVNTWDILFTDADTRDNNGKLIPCKGTADRPNYKIPNKRAFAHSHRISKDFTCKKARYGVYSMIIRRSGMKKLLDFFNKYKIFLPYDIDCFYAPGLKVYTCNKSIVAHRLDAASDNGGENYLNK